MDRITTGTLAAVLAALTAGGCVHVHTDADGKVKSVELGARAAKAEPAGGVVQQASATVPAAAVPAAASGLKTLAAKMPAIGGPPAATAIHTNWQNRVARLPDPTADGKFRPGLVGQLFLLSGGKQPCTTADGRLTVELFDATPRPGAADPVRLGSWTFEKDVLAKLGTVDERFGPSYALFLPWPTYTPAVTRVMMMARYEPENGYVLHADPMTMTIDTTTGPEGPQVQRSSSTALPSGVGLPVVQPGMPAGSPGPAAGGFPAAPGQFPVSPGGPPMAPTGPPPGFPPLTITVPAR